MKEKVIELMTANPLISSIVSFIIAILLFHNAFKDKRSFKQHGILSWRVIAGSYAVSFMLVLFGIMMLKEYFK